MRPKDVALHPPDQFAELASFRSQVLYLFLGLSLGYSSRSLPFNLAPADAFIAITFLAYAYSGQRLRYRHVAVVPFATGAWLIAVGQLMSAGPTFGAADLAAVLKDCLPPFATIAVGILAIGRPDRVIAIIVGSGIAISATALLSSTDGARLRGGLGNPNLTAHFAATLIVSALLVCAILWRKLSPMGRAAILLVTLPASTLVVVRTGSFGALTLLLGSVAYFIWSRTSVLEPILKLPVRLASIGAVYVVATRAPISQVLEGVEIGPGLNAPRFERSSAGRVELWTDGIEFFLTHPLGVGPRPSSAPEWSVAAGEFHHDLLDMGASGGLLAVAGLGAIIWGLWRMGGAGGPTRVLLAGLALSALTRQTWNFRHAWIMVAVVAAAESFRRDPQRSSRSTCESP